ncbi:hypothetical protein [Streptomyces sp. Amel2xC10]|uniref:hypothetical protein n=1 Tax=Streptomyces sp. Amel2xC10 TaxID=1305826 RepID=UPI000A087637|nr:hypothetical protein [Streptomyces sp. Amel2xC10]SMF50956.1 hypothetical protein SAMN02745830_04081 [Streptomyces sp. Amel2xC10]
MCHVLVLPHRRDSAWRARCVIRVVLRGWGLAGEDIEEAVLVASELVTGSLALACPPLTLSLYYAGRPG